MHSQLTNAAGSPHKSIMALTFYPGTTLAPPWLFSVKNLCQLCAKRSPALPYYKWRKAGKESRGKQSRGKESRGKQSWGTRLGLWQLPTWALRQFFAHECLCWPSERLFIIGLRWLIHDNLVIVFIAHELPSHIPQAWQIFNAQLWMSAMESDVTPSHCLLTNVVDVSNVTFSKHSTSETARK